MRPSSNLAQVAPPVRAAKRAAAKRAAAKRSKSAPPPATPAADGVGQKLRHRRKVRKMALNEVAQRAGLSIGLLSQIERGLSTPSLRSLNQICQALEMPLRWLFDEEPGSAAGEEKYVVRLANRRRMNLGNAAMAKEILSTDAIPQLQLMRFVLHPGAESGPTPNPNATGAKAGTVIAGQLRLEVDGSEFVLNPGDSFSFLASANYRFSCASDVDCEMFWAVTPALY